MYLGKVMYSKTFISETDKEDVSRHGGPVGMPSQKINTEDEKIREEIQKSYSFQKNICFDGMFLYSFNFRSELCEDDSLGGEENKKYTSMVFIKKMGNVDLKSCLCDLEKYLIGKGFKLQK